MIAELNVAEIVVGLGRFWMSLQVPLQAGFDVLEFVGRDIIFNGFQGSVGVRRSRVADAGPDVLGEERCMEAENRVCSHERNGKEYRTSPPENAPRE